MQLELMKSKIHRARLTHCDIDYEGSLEIDPCYLEEVGMFPYEKILVVNATNGNRLETYAIPGDRGSGVFRLNGAAAHCGRIGDIITVMSFIHCTAAEAPGIEPKIIVLDESNRIVSRRIGKKEL